MVIAIIVALAVGFLAAKMTVGRSAGAQLQAKQKDLDVACRDAEKFRSRCKEMQEEIDKLLSENRKLHSSRKSMEDDGFDMDNSVFILLPLLVRQSIVLRLLLFLPEEPRKETHKMFYFFSLAISRS